LFIEKQESLLSRPSRQLYVFRQAFFFPFPSVGDCPPQLLIIHFPVAIFVFFSHPCCFGVGRFHHLRLFFVFSPPESCPSLASPAFRFPFFFSSSFGAPVLALRNNFFPSPRPPKAPCFYEGLFFSHFPYVGTWPFHYDRDLVPVNFPPPPPPSPVGTHGPKSTSSFFCAGRAFFFFFGGLRCFPFPPP